MNWETSVMRTRGGGWEALPLRSDELQAPCRNGAHAKEQQAVPEPGDVGAAIRSASVPNGDLDQAEIRGNIFFSEIVFLHRASRTLVVADLVENLNRETTSTLGRLLARPFGIGSRPVASPEHRFYTSDAEAAAESFRRIQAWDFERIVLSHGGLIESGGHAVLRAVGEQLLDRVRRRSDAAKRVLALLARLQ